jgi:hypothetical protein
VSTGGPSVVIATTGSEEGETALQVLLLMLSHHQLLQRGKRRSANGFASQSTIPPAFSCLWGACSCQLDGCAGKMKQKQEMMLLMEMAGRGTAFTLRHAPRKPL